MIRLTLLLPLFMMTGQNSLTSPTTELQNPAAMIVADGTSPAAVYLHFDADSILYRSVAGLADVARRRPVDKETTFNLFSVTKTLTATAILQLAEQGLVALDTPVVKYLGEFPYGDRVTLRHLLTHTGGLPNPLPLSWVHFPEEHERFDEHAFFETIFSKNPKTRSEPGATMRYSNLDYVWLGWVIERVSGKPYEAYVQEHLLSKSGAGERAGFRIDPQVHAKGYQPFWSFMNLLLGMFIDKAKLMGPREGKWKPFRYNQLNGSAYGGLIGTPNDLARFGQALLQDRLLQPASRTELFREALLNDGSLSGMSLSWFTGRFNGHDYRHHAGGGGGYYVEFRLYPALQRGSVLVLNRTGVSDQRLLDKLDARFISAR